MLEDVFIKAKSTKEDICKAPNSIVNNCLVKIEDEIIEKFGDLTVEKIEFIINYFCYLFEKKNLEISHYDKFLKEITILLDILHIELKYFIDLLRAKDYFRVDEELHFLIINDKIEYFKTNFAADKVYFNYENPSLELLIKNLTKLEEKLDSVAKKYSNRFFNSEQGDNKAVIDINNPDPLIMECREEIAILDKREKEKIDNLQIAENFLFLKDTEKLRKNSNSNLEGLANKGITSANLEKYFLAVIEKGLLFHMRCEYKEAFNEYTFAKFLLEQIIFMRLIYEINTNSDINCNNDNFVFDKDRFLGLLNFIDMDNVINMCNEENLNNKEKKVKTLFSKGNKDNLFFFTFSGGFYKTFNEKKIIITNNNDTITEDQKLDLRKNYENLLNENKSLNSFVLFYKELYSMIADAGIKVHS